jgi:spermidine synthase
VDDLQDWLEWHPAVAGSLQEAGFGATEELSVDLLATYAGQARDLKEWLQGAQINTDRNLRLQYLAGMALNRLLSARILKDILVDYRFPDNLITGSEERLSALKSRLAASGRRSPRRSFQSPP